MKTEGRDEMNDDLGGIIARAETLLDATERETDAGVRAARRALLRGMRGLDRLRSESGAPADALAAGLRDAEQRLRAGLDARPLQTLAGVFAAGLLLGRLLKR